MKKTMVVLCALASALMLAGSAAAGHKPAPGGGLLVTPLSFSSGR